MIAGVDGTSNGWVAVLCEDDLSNPTPLFLKKLIALPRSLRMLAIDIPIGLPDKGSRDADRLARLLLGEPRRRSVFPCPIRSVLGASSWEDACSRTERADGRRVSKQTYAILQKIIEADAFVRSSSWGLAIFREVHPEVSFAKWSGAPMVHNKKSSAGREERRRVIATVFGADAFQTAVASIRGNSVGSDDLADAFAAVWSACRILHGKAEKFPNEQAVDGMGLPMHIWA
jgi:predicted RNase H-like nuclease